MTRVFPTSMVLSIDLIGFNCLPMLFNLTELTLAVTRLTRCMKESGILGWPTFSCGRDRERMTGNTESAGIKLR